MSHRILIIQCFSELLRGIVVEFAPNWLRNAFNEHAQRSHEVPLRYLHTEALRTRDEFLMAIYREKNSSWVRSFIDYQQARTLMSGLVLLLIANA